MKPTDVAGDGRVSFDSVAGIYRVLEYAAFGRALEAARFRYLDRLASCREILIVGEGDGRALQRILTLAPQASVRCIDSSVAMLARAEARLDPGARARVSFEHADARTATIAPSSYDAVVTMFVLDCFSPDDVARVVDRLASGLRTDGRWLFADFSIPERGWPRLHARLWVAFLYAFFRWRTGLPVRELPPSEELLRAAGLTLVEHTTLRRGLLTAAVYARRSGASFPSGT
jgi:ubiquinone/menaquinone biosynthesis C-methylase UbiE